MKMRALWFKHINTTLQKPMYFPPLFPFFSRFCCKIPNQILWLPAGFYASHKWCDCQTDKHAISQSGEGKKKSSLSLTQPPITKALLISPMKKSK